MVGTLSKITSTGLVTYTVHFTTSGSKTIRATCNNVFGTTTVTVATMELKILSVTPTVNYK
jgi:heat shock protein HslJ